MPKMKTHKGAKGRFHITGTGKIMRTKIGKSHLRIRKNKRIKHLFDKKIQLSAVDKKRIKQLLPYGV
ncbi:50S ribosomal protein L35 [Chloroflexota bacterium]